MYIPLRCSIQEACAPPCPEERRGSLRLSTSPRPGPVLFLHFRGYHRRHAAVYPYSPSVLLLLRLNRIVLVNPIHGCTSAWVVYISGAYVLESSHE